MPTRNDAARLTAIAMVGLVLAVLIGCTATQTETTQTETTPTETTQTETTPTEQEQTGTSSRQPPSTDATATHETASVESQVATPLKRSELLLELPDSCDTPDGMCLLPNGDILLAVPNVNSWNQAVALDKANAKQDPPPVLMRITSDNKLKKYYDPPTHPETGKAFPFGLCIDPEGKNLYVADLQWFADPANPGNRSRVLRIPLNDNYEPAGEPVVLIEGMVIANAVIVHDGYLYVSDTAMVPKTDPAEPLVSGIFRVKLSEEGTKLTLPLLDDPHLVATMKTYNPDVGFGADGLTFDSKGNLYCGNFADGTLHVIKFDADGNPTQRDAQVFAQSPLMKSCDGLFCDLKTDQIYVADSLANAVHIVSPDGSVQVLAQNAESDGAGGQLDQPNELLIRGNELIVANMDFPVPGGVNTKWDKPYTISVIKLD